MAALQGLPQVTMVISRLLKNPPAYRRQASASLSGPLTISRACPKLLLIRRNGTPHPSSLQRTSKYASGRLTNSPAWQEVAPYSSRRHSQGFEGLASACLREAASAKAGTFLSNLGKTIFSANFSFSTWRIWCSKTVLL